MYPSSTLVTATVAGLLALTAATVLGAEGSHRCADVVNDQARLACYDAAFGKPAAGPQAAPDAVAAKAATGAAVATAATAEDAARARAEFGLSEAAKRASQPDQRAAPDSITGQVASIGRRPTGEEVVTLTDGQVWAQIESDTSSRVKVGDSVTIRKATLGSYLLVGPNRIAVRVRRLK